MNQFCRAGYQLRLASIFIVNDTVGLDRANWTKIKEMSSIAAT